MRIALLNITRGGMSGGYRWELGNTLLELSVHTRVSALLVGVPRAIDVSAWRKRFPAVEWLPLKTPALPWRCLSRDAEERVKRFAPDVIYIPTARYWKLNGVPVVTMLRNMEPLLSPYEGNPPLERLRNWARSREARKAVTEANRVIAISGFVKDFLVKHWGVPEAKIGVVYHGIEWPSPGAGEVKPASVPESWRGRFLFTAGSIRPARGLEDAISVLRGLVVVHPEVTGLVIGGETDRGMMRYRRRLEREIRRSGLESRVCWAGWLSAQEMAWCYRSCRLFLMTSRAEAFGMIAVEAMSHGCLCVATDNSCLPEIFGEAALFYPPGSFPALDTAVRTVLGWDENQRQERSQRAKRQADRFSFDRKAEMIFVELERTVRGEVGQRVEG